MVDASWVWPQKGGKPDQLEPYNSITYFLRRLRYRKKPENLLGWTVLTQWSCKKPKQGKGNVTILF